MVDAAVSKTAEGNLVRVRLPLPARWLPQLGKAIVATAMRTSRVVVPQAALSGVCDGSRATAKETRSKTAAAPAPNKMHNHAAKVGRR
jgi:hypothetical protein